MAEVRRRRWVDGDTKVNKVRLEWLCHLARMPDHSMPKGWLTILPLALATMCRVYVYLILSTSNPSHYWNRIYIALHKQCWNRI